MVNSKKMDLQFDCNKWFYLYIYLFWILDDSSISIPLYQSIAKSYIIMRSFFPPNLLAQASQFTLC